MTPNSSWNPEDMLCGSSSGATSDEFIPLPHEIVGLIVPHLMASAVSAHAHWPATPGTLSPFATSIASWSLQPSTRSQETALVAEAINSRLCASFARLPRPRDSTKAGSHRETDFPQSESPSSCQGFDRTLVTSYQRLDLSPESPQGSHQRIVYFYFVRLFRHLENLKFLYGWLGIWEEPLTTWHQLLGGCGRQPPACRCCKGFCVTTHPLSLRPNPSLFVLAYPIQYRRLEVFVSPHGAHQRPTDEAHCKSPTLCYFATALSSLPPKNILPSLVRRGPLYQR